MKDFRLASLVLVCAQHLAAAEFTFEGLKTAFESPEGLMLSVGDPSAHSSAKPSSKTVWSSTLPLALFSSPRGPTSDAAGIILHQEKLQQVCSYPVNANTIVRYSITDPSQKDACGLIGGRWKTFNLGNVGGECRFQTQEDFLQAYFYKPMYQYPSFLGMPEMWALEYNVCHFKQVSDMLVLQNALLKAMAVTPATMTQAEAVGNATKMGAGITAYNEVIVGPYSSDAVGALFWAHPGGFRTPGMEEGAFKLACYFKGEEHASLPVFELAGVNLERPFQGCQSEATKLDCLKTGIDEWQANMTNGGRQVADFVRELDKQSFLDILHNAPPGACQQIPNMQMPSLGGSVEEPQLAIV